ncbi:MarR family transcriptional regulator [Tropicibacter sp. R15_0]|uniref:MarR family winged helix-turn-helix transcriptional regulator n=1 Tax=Tropicibacter sp. R15_0 TaxID=2821101 RepID=UPI001ADB4934|nr:MarR family transcriptional regulator [Tropicibacter sp. R15_0]MBO9463923.1 MarR family transcriptional regulator [Tropicibacter sp. R15_0]
MTFRISDDLEQLETFFPYQLAVAAERFSRDLMEVYNKAYGLTREEWRLLFLLSEEGEIASNDLAQRTTLDKVQLSRASQRLADKGLITRNVSPKDRRLKLYQSTEKGRALFAEIKPQVDARASDIVSSMSKEQKAALQMGLNGLLEALGAPEQMFGD